MPSHKLVVRGTTTLSLHERFTRLSQIKPATPSAPSAPALIDRPTPTPPRPQPMARTQYLTPDHRPRTQPRALEPWAVSPQAWPSPSPSPSPALFHRPVMRRSAPPFSGPGNRNATGRTGLLHPRRSMVQRLGVRRHTPRATWGGRAMRRERVRPTLRRRYGGVFLNRGVAGRGRGRRSGIESAGGSRGARSSPSLSKEELDSQLDQYMSRTKNALDQDLVAYHQSGGAT